MLGLSVLKRGKFFALCELKKENLFVWQRQRRGGLLLLLPLLSPPLLKGGKQHLQESQMWSSSEQSLTWEHKVALGQ